LGVSTCKTGTESDGPERVEDKEREEREEEFAIKFSVCFTKQTSNTEHTGSKGERMCEIHKQFSAHTHRHTGEPENGRPEQEEKGTKDRVK